MNTQEKLALYLDEAIAQLDSFWKASPTPQRWFGGETRRLCVEMIARSNEETRKKATGGDCGPSQGTE